jgi:rod shape-determining protein MreC
VAIRPSRGRSTRLLMVTLVSISLITITVDYRAGSSGPLEGAGKAALTVITPMQEAVSKITRPVGDFLSSIGHLPSLESQNSNLKQQVAQLQSDLAKTSADQQRLAELEGELKLNVGAAHTVGATVIANSVSDFEWSVTIDKGTGDGVGQGDAVVSAAGVVGTVTRAGPISSQVQLIIDPAANVAGAIQSTPPQQGLIAGDGENDLKMGLLPRGTPSADLVGKLVVTVSYSVGTGADIQTNLFPPGIPIGRVSRVLQSNGSLSPYVAVAPTVDFSTLENVLVVLSPNAG